MEFTYLETARLKLRLITPEIIKQLWEERDEANIRTFLGLKTDEAYAQAEDRYAQGMWTYNRKFCYFQLIGREDNKIMGWCGYHSWYTDHARAELGYELFEDHLKGMGLMSEAIPPILHYGFSTLKLHRIEAMVSTHNIPSTRLLENNKFVKEGHLREHYFKKNVPEDSLVYALLVSEYNSL